VGSEIGAGSEETESEVGIGSEVGMGLEGVDSVGVDSLVDSEREERLGFGVFVEVPVPKAEE